LIIDMNVDLFQWPFRRLPGAETSALVATLRKHGVSQACAGSFEGVFHKDIASANARLSAECLKFDRFLLPFGSINPRLPDWREDVRRCREQHRMRGIRLHPNYHGYTLEDSEFRQLLHVAAGHKLVVQLALTMEDERTQHPLMRVPPVDTSPLPDVVKAERGLKLMILNCYPQLPIERLRPISSAGEVCFDSSMIERVDGLTRLSAQVSPERIVFGSHSPFFCFDSALLKLREASPTAMTQAAILSGNARRLLET
jgi:predicted TIM-barrel fold metal-dependent hydrolase